MLHCLFPFINMGRRGFSSRFRGPSALSSPALSHRFWSLSMLGSPTSDHDSFYSLDRWNAQMSNPSALFRTTISLRAECDGLLRSFLGSSRSLLAGVGTLAGMSPRCCGVRAPCHRHQNRESAGVGAKRWACSLENLLSHISYVFVGLEGDQSLLHAFPKYDEILEKFDDSHWYSKSWKENTNLVRVQNNERKI